VRACDRREPLDLLLGGARVIEQLRDDGLDALRLSGHAHEQVARLRVQVGLVEQQLGVADDRRERVADLVRDACREPSDRRQPLRSLQPLALTRERHSLFAQRREHVIERPRELGQLGRAVGRRRDVELTLADARDRVLERSHRTQNLELEQRGSEHQQQQPDADRDDQHLAPVVGAPPGRMLRDHAQADALAIACRDRLVDDQQVVRIEQAVVDARAELGARARQCLEARVHAHADQLLELAIAACAMNLVGHAQGSRRVAQQAVERVALKVAAMKRARGQHREPARVGRESLDFLLIVAALPEPFGRE
jgi:hypothetical protein